MTAPLTPELAAVIEAARALHFDPAFSSHPAWTAIPKEELTPLRLALAVYDAAQEGRAE